LHLVPLPGQAPLGRREPPVAPPRAPWHQPAGRCARHVHRRA